METRGALSRVPIREAKPKYLKSSINVNKDVVYLYTFAYSQWPGITAIVVGCWCAYSVLVYIIYTNIWYSINILCDVICNFGKTFVGQSLIKYTRFYYINDVLLMQFREVLAISKFRIVKEAR